MRILKSNKTNNIVSTQTTRFLTQVKQLATPYLTKTTLNIINTIAFFSYIAFFSDYSDAPLNDIPINGNQTPLDSLATFLFLILYFRINCPSWFINAPDLSNTSLQTAINRGKRLEWKLEQLLENTDIESDLDEEAKQYGIYCGVKYGIMTCPVTRSDGHRYDYNSTFSLSVSPYSRQALTNDIHPDLTLQDQIEEWLDEKLKLHHINLDAVVLNLG